MFVPAEYILTAERTRKRRIVTYQCVTRSSTNALTQYCRCVPIVQPEKVESRGLQWIPTVKKTEILAWPEFLKLVSEEFQHQSEILS